MTYACPVRPRVGKLLENGVGKLPEKSVPIVGHFPENSQIMKETSRPSLSDTANHRLKSLRLAD